MVTYNVFLYKYNKLCILEEQNHSFLWYSSE